MMVMDGIAWYSMVFHGIPWYSMVLHSIDWYYMVYIVWYLMMLCNIGWYFIELDGIGLHFIYNRKLDYDALYLTYWDVRTLVVICILWYSMLIIWVLAIYLKAISIIEKLLTNIE